MTRQTARLSTGGRAPFVQLATRRALRSGIPQWLRPHRARQRWAKLRQAVATQTYASRWLKYYYREGGAGQRRDRHAFQTDFNCEVAILEPAVYDKSLRSAHSDMLRRIQLLQVAQDNSYTCTNIYDQMLIHATMDAYRPISTEEEYLVICYAIEHGGHRIEVVNRALRENANMARHYLQALPDHLRVAHMRQCAAEEEIRAAEEAIRKQRAVEEEIRAAEEAIRYQRIVELENRKLRRAAERHIFDKRNQAIYVEEAQRKQAALSLHYLVEEDDLLQPAKRMCLGSSFNLQYADELDAVGAVDYKSGIGAAAAALAAGPDSAECLLLTLFG